MATAQQKAFCVIEYGRSESTTVVQRAFRTKYPGVKLPDRWCIKRWYKQFTENGCLCKGKSSGRPRTSDENVARIQQAFVRSPGKSTRRGSRELQIPQSTVWRVLRKRLVMKPYRLTLVQALSAADKIKRIDFCDFILAQMETDESFVSKIVFSDEATFHTNGKVNRHNVCIWGTENPRETIQYERDSPKVNVFCAISTNKVFGPFFFEGATVTGLQYLEMLENWLFPQLEQEAQQFIFQQDGAPPHWHLSVRTYLNVNYPSRWIGRQAARDRALHHWPPRSPDLTPCDFFLWGYVKDMVYRPPLPATIDDLKRKITVAIQTVTPDMLQRVWNELEYRVDIARVSGGGHIEHL